MQRGERTVALTLGLAVTLASSALHAQNAKEQANALFATKFEVDESDPARKVPSVAERDAAPLDFAYFVMNLGEKAEEAAKKGDRAAQIRYLRGVAAALPDRSAVLEAMQRYEADRSSQRHQSCAPRSACPGRASTLRSHVRVLFGQQEDLILLRSPPSSYFGARRAKLHIHQSADVTVSSRSAARMRALRGCAGALVTTGGRIKA